MATKMVTKKTSTIVNAAGCVECQRREAEAEIEPHRGTVAWWAAKERLRRREVEAARLREVEEAAAARLPDALGVAIPSPAEEAPAEAESSEQKPFVFVPYGGGGHSMWDGVWVETATELPVAEPVPEPATEECETPDADAPMPRAEAGPSPADTRMPAEQNFCCLTMKKLTVSQEQLEQTEKRLDLAIKQSQAERLRAMGFEIQLAKLEAAVQAERLRAEKAEGRLDKLESDGLWLSNEDYHGLVGKWIGEQGGRLYAKELALALLKSSK